MEGIEEEEEEEEEEEGGEGEQGEEFSIHHEVHDIIFRSRLNGTSFCREV